LARRKAETNSGTRSGIIAFTLDQAAGLEISSARHLRFLIRSVSSVRIGMKRSAIDMVIAIS
jgi:hypothetical protein